MNLSTAPDTRSGIVQVKSSPSSFDMDQFVNELHLAKQEVEIAQGQFDTIADPMLIDHIIFRLGAAEKRLNFLIQLARKMNLVVDGVRWDLPGFGLSSK